MTDGPYRVIDLLTNDILGRYESYDKAHLAHLNKPIDVQYKPLKRHKPKVTKK